MSIRIRFLPEGRSCDVEESVALSTAAAECDLLVDHPCGGRGTCGRCRVRVPAGAPCATPAERRALGNLVVEGWRLGCTLVFEADAVVELPRDRRTIAAKGFGEAALDPRTFLPARPGALGMAFDVGTTTVAGALIELESGAVRAAASALNPQVRWGADVMSRITHARDHRRGAGELRQALRHTLRALIGDCCASAGTGQELVEAVAFVGNPTMMHSVLGLDVAPLGEAPYEGTLAGAWSGPAIDLELGVAPDARAYVAPAVRSHVGADTVASVLATELDRVSHPTLLIDLGTNSEIVLAGAEGLLCASTSAGPAFEGAHIADGMRAAPGAIDRVRVRADGSLVTHTLGGGTAAGLCGSGLVDAVAELVRVGAIERSGRVRPAAELSALPGLGRRIASRSGGRAVRLAGRGADAVSVTAADVRQLQLAKASIAAGIALLLDRAGVGVEDLDRVLLAGAFGGSLRQASALAIGLVPPVDAERVQFAGCTAAAGARLLLVDAAARERAARIAATAVYVDLAGRPEYETAFVDALAFPPPPTSLVPCPPSWTAASASSTRENGSSRS